MSVCTSCRLFSLCLGEPEQFCSKNAIQAAQGKFYLCRQCGALTIRNKTFARHHVCAELYKALSYQHCFGVCVNYDCQRYEAAQLFRLEHRP